MGRILAELGCVVSDSDADGRAALRDAAIREQIVDWWGTEVLDEQGEVDRSAVAHIVFSRPDDRKRLESLTHPWIASRRKDRWASAPPETVAFVNDAPLLFETGLDKLSLDRAGEFLEMAATLIRVKAQLLLPRPGAANWDEDPRQDLIRRLLEFEHFQDVVHVLSTAESQRARHFGKGYIAARSIPRPVRPALEVSMIDFLEAAARIPQPRPEAQVVPPSDVVSLKEKASLIRRLMRGAQRVAFETVLAPFRTRPHAVASFLACLELAKQRVLRIEQTGPFGSIWLFPSRHLKLTDED